MNDYVHTILIFNFCIFVIYDYRITKLSRAKEKSYIVWLKTNVIREWEMKKGNMKWFSQYTVR